MYASTAFNQNLAVVVGINRYGHGIAQLRTATNDAEALAQLLKSEHGYDVHLLLNEAASKQELLHWLSDRLPQIVTPNDRVLFYFAGHGVAIDGEDGPAGYLVPQDAKPGDDGTFLSMQALHNALTALPCRHSLIILDCCFSGAFRWSSTRDIATHPEVIYKERFDRFIQSPAWQVITSSAYDQTAFDLLQDQRGQGHTGQHSPFAEALFDALHGQADRFPVGDHGQPSGDGVITATELYLYLRDRVELATEAIERLQTPGLWPLRKHDKGEYIFLVPGHELNLPSAPELNAANNPYRGLEAFDEAQAHLYFGREQLVEDLYPFVMEHPLTVVLGPSGTGKSSLVKAGLIPVLRNAVDAEWQILPPIRPGDAPLKALARAILSLEFTGDGQIDQIEALAEDLAQDSQELPRRVLAWGSRHPQKQLLLVIDQVEELITQCRSEKERQQFLELLKMALRLSKTRGRIVITLRSDFEPQFQPWLSSTWMQRRFLVKPMTQDELRQAIAAPAAERVMVFEPYSLVDQLINEVVQMPGALPLLSFTLSELYLKYLRRQDGARTLTQADYEALGGVAGSLTQRATQEYEALKQKDLAYEHTMKRVMLRMVAIEGGELARRRVPRSELVYADAAENARVETVIQRLVAARLVVEGQDSGEEPYVEPAHDALTQGWNQLQRWKNEEQENLSLQRLLTPAAMAWQYNKKNVQDLWTNNSRLDLLKEVSNSKHSWLNKLEATFVQQSLRRRRNNRYRWVSGLTIAVTALTGISITAGTFAIRAEEEALNANIRAEAFRVESLMASDLHFDAWLVALELGQRVREKERQFSAKSSLVTNSRSKQSGETSTETFLVPKPRLRSPVRLQAVAAMREIYNFSGYLHRNTLVGHTGRVNSVNFSPDGETLASASGDNIVRLWDMSGRELQTLEGHSESVTYVSFSPDGQTIASASHDGTVKLWDVSGRELQTLEGHLDEVWSVSFSPDGHTIASASFDGTVKLWGRNGQELRTIASHNRSFRENITTSVTFSPNGQIIALTSNDRNYFYPRNSHIVKLWDVSGRELQTLEGHSDEVSSVSFSPDGQTIASASHDGTVKLWDVSGRELQTLKGHSDEVWSVSFSPDGQMIASASFDGTVKLWDKSGRELQTLESGSDWVFSVSFSPDGQTVASAGSDGTVKLWDKSDRELQTLEGHSDEVSSVSFSPNGQTIASASHDGSVKLWDISGRELQTLESDSDWVFSVSFSPDGQTIASAGSGSIEGIVKLWDISGRELQTLESDSDWVLSVSFSPDGQTITSASIYGTVKLWDVSGRELQTLASGWDLISSVSFSPDGQTIAIASSIGSTVVLQNVSGRQLQTLEGHSDRVTCVSFSPDGQTVAIASHDGRVKLWDVSGRELQTLEGHSGRVTSVSFSPVRGVSLGAHSWVIATASQDGTVKLWDGSNGQELQTFESYSDQVTSVSFSPDGNLLAGGSKDGTVILWNFDLDDLMARSCTWLRDYMTNPTTTPEHKALCQDDLPELASLSQPESVSWLNPIASAFTRITEALSR